MAEPVGEDRQAKFVLTRTSGYRTLAANGVWGGITPRGDLQVEFLVESSSMPETLTHLVKPDGTLGEELSRTPREKTFTRESQVGVILSIPNAESIGRWLLNKVAEYKAAQAQKEQGR